MLYEVITANLEELISATNTSTAASIINYIDSTVQVESAVVPLQDGSATFTYTLGSDCSSCYVAITDSSGDVVYSMQGEADAGTYTIAWDGKDMDGEQMPDGAYNIMLLPVSADSSDSDVETLITVFGKVTGVAKDDDGSYNFV